MNTVILAVNLLKSLLTVWFFLIKVVGPVCGKPKEKEKRTFIACKKEAMDTSTLVNMLVLYRASSFDFPCNITVVYPTSMIAQNSFNRLVDMVLRSDLPDVVMSDTELTVCLNKVKIYFVGVLSKWEGRSNAAVFLELSETYPERDAVLDAAKNTLLSHQAAFEKGEVSVPRIN